MRTPLLLALGTALAGCASLDAPAGTADDAAAGAPPGMMIVTPAPERPAPSEFTTAILEDGTFQHPRLDAPTQTTIIWWNVDDLVHSVVSDDGGFAGSGPIPQGGEFERTFQTPGDFPFHCRYHPDMKGIVVIR